MMSERFFIQSFIFLLIEILGINLYGSNQPTLFDREGQETKKRYGYLIVRGKKRLLLIYFLSTDYY